MRKIPSTKKALVMSILSLTLCFCMLAGTTYAWFTDSVTSANNKIQAGTLKIDLELLETNGAWTSIKNDPKPIFNYDKWEPGYTEVKILKVENEGTLALKWKARFVSSEKVNMLADVIDVYVLPTTAAAENTPYENALVYPTDRNLNGYTKVGTLAEFINTIETTTTGVLKAGESAYLAIALVMQTSAGNEYQGQGLNAFDIQISAAQVASEEDSFNNQYDASATYAPFGSATVEINDAETNYETTVYDTQIPGDNNKVKIAYAKFSKDALADNTKDVNVTVEKLPAVDNNITVQADQGAMTFDVSVSNVKENNDSFITVGLRVGAGLTGIKLFHDSVEIPAFPNKNAEGEYYTYSGEYLELNTTHFSPFTVLHDKVAEEVDPTVGTIPVAAVTLLKDAQVDEWKNYGGFKPASATQKLSAIYSFVAPETEVGKYSNWLCDYYVKVESETLETLPEGSITLGGNYGSFGWVGFDNPEVSTNEFIPLLGSVLGNEDDEVNGVNTYWTYDKVRSAVGTFLCGVAVADGNTTNLGDAKFVVELRLTNPENHSEYIAVNTVTYTFVTGDSTFATYQAN